MAAPRVVPLAAGDPLAREARLHPQQQVLLQGVPATAAPQEQHLALTM
jgi:hypothetical protein